MKVKVIDYTGPSEDRNDVTVGKTYEVLEEGGHGHICILDDAGEPHSIEKGCFEVIKETPEHTPRHSNGNLPPVGSVVRVSIDNQEWREVEIVAYFEKTRSIIIYEAPWTPEIYEWDDCKFKPLKSQEEIEKEKQVDKISKELLESVNKHGQDFRHLEWEIAEHLYNAGLRFKEDSK